MIKKYKIYLGLNDRVTKTRICGDNSAVMSQVKHIIGDCTINWVNGVYTYNDGSLCIEDTAVIEVLDFNNELMIDSVINLLGKTFNQESVAFEETEVNSTLKYIKY